MRIVVFGVAVAAQILCAAPVLAEDSVLLNEPAGRTSSTRVSATAAVAGGGVKRMDKVSRESHVLHHVGTVRPPRTLQENLIGVARFNPRSFNETSGFHEIFYIDMNELMLGR